MKITGKLISWVVSMLFIIFFIAVRPFTIANIFMLLAGVITMPIINNFIQSKTNKFTSTVKWVTFAILVICAIIIYPNSVEESINSESAEIERIQVEEKLNYKFSSYILEGDKKTDKIVADENISDKEAEEIYENLKEQNEKYDYTIWIFSSEEEAKNATSYDVAEIKKENNEIKVTNYKKEVARLKVVQEREEKEKREQEEARRLEEERQKEVQAKAQTQKVNTSSTSSSNKTQNTATTSTPAITQNTNNNNSSIVYITNTGKKYHLSNCSYLNKSKIETTLGSVLASEYGACSKCKP